MKAIGHACPEIHGERTFIMKKLLLIALLTVAMVFTLVACTEEKPPEETTGETTGVTSGESADETAAETPADTDPVDETDPPVEETDPPIEETEPPVEETDPPAKETDPPAKETDPPVEETDPPETEAPDPNQPTLLITADALTPGQGYWDMEAPILSEDGSYITITPSGNDPYYNPLGNPAYLEGDRYLVVKYRTDKGQDTSLQIYAGSGSLASDNDMLKTDIVSDGEWHLAIFDLMLIDGQTSDLTGASTAAGYYDGSTVAFLRLDAMEVNYILNDEGKPYKVPAPDGTTEIWARYDMPTDAYIDIAYLAFFSTEEGAMVYEYGEPSKPTLVIGDETIELDLIENWDSVYGEPFMGWGSIASDGNGNVKINCDGTDILCVYGINGGLTNAESAAITGFEHIVFSIDTTNSTSDLQFIFQPEKEAGVNFTTGPVGSAYLVKEDGSIVEIAPNSYNRWGYNIPKGTKGTLILPYTTISNYDNGDTADVNENDLPAYGSAAEASITRLGFMIVPQNGQSGGDMIIGDVYVCGAIAAITPTNVALGKTVTTNNSTEGLGFFGVAQLTDGSYDDDFGAVYDGANTPLGWHNDTSKPGVSSVDNPSYIDIDLDGSYAISAVKLIPMAFYLPQSTVPQDFDLQYSTDGVNWTTIQSATGVTCVWGTDAPLEYTFESVTANYFRLNITKDAAFNGGYTTLGEIQVYGIPA